MPTTSAELDGDSDAGTANADSFGRTAKADPSLRPGSSGVKGYALELVDVVDDSALLMRQFCYAAKRGFSWRTLRDLLKLFKTL